MAVLLGGFTVCSGAVVVGGLVLYFALAPDLESNSVEERLVRRRIRHTFEQASNAMVTVGIMLMAVKMIGVWLTAKSDARSEIIAVANLEVESNPFATPRLAVNPPPVVSSPLPEKSGLEKNRDSQVTLPTKGIDSQQVPESTNKQAKIGSETVSNSEEWYISVLERLVEILANPPEPPTALRGMGFQFRRDPKTRDKMIGVVLLGKFNGAQQRFLQQRVDETREKVRSDNDAFGTTTQNPKGMVTVQGSLRNVQEFADGIEFGKVVKVDLERRFVVVQPSGIEEVKSRIERTYKYKGETRPARGAELANILPGLSGTGGSGRRGSSFNNHEALQSLRQIEPTA